MMIIRPLGADDYPALRELARITGAGFTSLQDNDEQVQGKFEAALAAFANPEADCEKLFLFVLEDTETEQVVGICGIESAVGLSDPWYNYRLGTQVHASRELEVYNKMTTLTISNDHTGYSELCTLFLHPDYRHSRNGHLLSKSRFMFMAEYPQLFDEHVIAEMRGYSDQHGISPFWEGLGRHFFSIDFAAADRTSSMNKAFIAELMPKYTLYVDLLPESAREVIGKTHENTLPARKLLEREGMHFSGYVDIFDAGPTLEARVQDIRAVKESRYVKVRIDDNADYSAHAEQWLVCNTDFNNFRCCICQPDMLGNHLINITTEVAKQLDITDGSTVRIVPLTPSGR